MSSLRGTNPLSRGIGLLIALIALVFVIYYAYDYGFNDSAEKINASATVNDTQTAQTLPVAPNSFVIQIKARGESVGLRTRMDDGDFADILLDAGGTKEFRPQRQLEIDYPATK